MLGSLGQTDNAIKQFESALDLNPESPEAYYNIGITYLALYEYSNAIQYFEKAIKFDDDNAAAYANKGVAFAATEVDPVDLNENEIEFVFGNKLIDIVNNKMIY